MKRSLFLLLITAVSFRAAAQMPYPEAPQPAAPVVKAEYFFNTDPGVGKATPVTFPASTNLANYTQSLPLNGSALSNGIHRLYIRTMDANGLWSITHSALFDNLVIQPYRTAEPTPDITDVEYFIDSDPGLGNGSKINITPATDPGTVTTSVNITGLNPGVHRLYIRTKDAACKWSLTNLSVFDNTALPPYPAAEAPAQAINQLEYFIDTDPGLGLATAIPATAATDLSSVSVTIPVGSLGAGTHTLYIRSKAAVWSHAAYAEFVVHGTLPLRWVYVEGKVQQQKAVLSWSTAQEMNTDHFVIEQSTDGSRFTAIGEVKATGSSNTANYSFVHLQMAKGFNYYRVKQVDVDGKFSYSKVITLLNNTELKEIVVGPNPAQNSIHVIQAEGGTLQRIELFTAAGAKVKEQTVAPGEGRVIQVNLQGLPAGVYSLRLTGKQGTETRMLLKN